MNKHVTRGNMAGAVAGLLLLSAAVSSAAELTKETLQEWQDYIPSGWRRTVSLDRRIAGTRPAGPRR